MPAVLEGAAESHAHVVVLTRRFCWNLQQQPEFNKRSWLLVGRGKKESRLVSYKLRAHYYWEDVQMTNRFVMTWKQLSRGLIVHQHVLGIGVAARNLTQLCFVITHQDVNAVLGSILDVGHLFANTTVDDVFRRNTKALYQLQLRLKHRYL